MTKRGYVDTCDGQIHYRYRGGSIETPIVFFHQTASSSQSYGKLMGLLEGKFPMFAMDTPGFGQSFFPPKAPTTTYYASILLEALSNLGIDSFHAFGHHTGAAIAVEMAAMVPGRVKTLMMDGPVWLSQYERQLWLDTAIDPMVIQEASVNGHVVQLNIGRKSQRTILNHYACTQLYLILLAHRLRIRIQALATQAIQKAVYLWHEILL